MVQEHIEKHGIGPGQLIFPVRLFAKRQASGKSRLSKDELDVLGITDPLPNGRRYSHGTMGAYITAKCRCRGCKQWSADYARNRKRARTGRVEREWSPRWRRDPTEYVGTDMYYICCFSPCEHAAAQRGTWFTGFGYMPSPSFRPSWLSGSSCEAGAVVRPACAGLMAAPPV